MGLVNALLVCVRALCYRFGRRRGRWRHRGATELKLFDDGRGRVHAYFGPFSAALFLAPCTSHVAATRIFQFSHQLRRLNRRQSVAWSFPREFIHSVESLGSFSLFFVFAVRHGDFGLIRRVIWYLYCII